MQVFRSFKSFKSVDEPFAPKTHSGGLSKINPSTGLRELFFSKCNLLYPEKELDFAFEKGFPSYITEDLECLKDNDQSCFVRWRWNNQWIYIKYEMTGAHCPYHQVFLDRGWRRKIYFLVAMLHR